MNNKSIHHKLYESRKLWIAASAFILSCNATTMIINADDVGYTQLNDTTAQTVSDYSPDADKVDQQIGVDDSQLQNAVSTAEKAGVVIVEEPTQTISIDANNAESIRQAKIESEGDYLQQISNIQNAQQKQLEKEKQYTEQFDEYNLALHKGKKQNADGKTQFVTSAAKQALKFDNSKPADESDPISDINPSNIFTGIGSHANLNDSTKVWEYEGNDLLHANIEKTWAKAGSIEDEYGHKQYVDFHETFHDFQLQNGNWNESTNSFEDNGSPHVAISSNAIDNIWTTNLNWQTTFWFTYSDTCEMVPISNQIASDSVPKVYFLSGSLSSTNYSMDKVTGNRREYVQTNDAKTAIINENSAITLDNIDCEGVVNNAPDGLAYTNTSPDFQSVEGDEDTNPQHYAIEEGVSFTDFTTDKPTLYFGAVPMNRKAWWWRQNHNMNSDELAFLKKPEKIDPETVSYHLNRIMYQQNNKLDPALTYSSDLSDGQNKAPKNFTKISATEPTADAVLSKKLR
ncbi:hypothetical protein GCM10025879_14620 [Leuconostoc litchii]|uniref:hypothetical protein n=1 Tax=Leuconostoc litchii TaxID=1981069 RepID=UPI0023EA418D|nr:hypothetical protein [Leuconostoc litchii]GMA70216.1 hypothetical protein GCM10025879_14620 [Leuconostoc litchii]